MHICALDIRDLKQYLENDINNANINELIQCCNYETLKKVEILDKNKKDKPYINTILKNIIKQLSTSTSKETPNIVLIHKDNTTAFDYANNNIIVEHLGAIKGLLYPRYIMHENTHSDEIIALKYQNLTNKKENDLLNKNKKVLNDIYPKIRIENEILKSNLFNESVLKQLYIANIIDPYIKVMQNMFYQQFVETGNINALEQYEKFKNFEYMSATEIEARIKELSVVEFEYKIIENESNLNIKINQLNTLKDNIEKIFKGMSEQKELINDYCKICKSILKQNKISEFKIFNQKETKDYTTEQMDKIIETTQSIKLFVEKEIDKTNKSIEKYIKKPELKELHNAIDLVLNNENTEYELLRYSINKTTTALETINKDFNINFIKYDTFQNNKKENNIKTLTGKLYKIYDTIDKMGINDTNRFYIKEQIESIFFKLFATEKNINLIDIDINPKIINLIEKASVFFDNINTQLLNGKMEEFILIKQMINHTEIIPKDNVYEKNQDILEK